MDVKLSNVKQVVLCRTQRTRWWRAAPREALDACAAAAGVATGALRCQRLIHVGKSVLVHVVARPDLGAGYVVKFPSDDKAQEDWCPANEYEGFNCAYERLSDQDEFGAIQPVGLGRDPKFLVTEYCPGTSALGLFDSAVASRSGRGMRQAAETAFRMGRWLRCFRGAPVEAEPGQLEPWRQTMRDLAEMLVGAVTERDADRVRTTRESALDAIRQNCTNGEYRPARGDLAPQNFQIGPDGKLYALDFEGFGWDAVERDAVAFRIRMERYGTAGAVARQRATEFWQSFCKGYLVEFDRAEAALTLAYLAGLAQRLTRFAAAPPRHHSALDRLRRTRPNWGEQRLEWLRSYAQAGTDSRRFFFETL